MSQNLYYIYQLLFIRLLKHLTKRRDGNTAQNARIYDGSLHTQNILLNFSSKDTMEILHIHARIYDGSFKKQYATIFPKRHDGNTANLHVFAMGLFLYTTIIANIFSKTRWKYSIL